MTISPTLTPRKRGRPPGSKNKVKRTSTGTIEETKYQWKCECGKCMRTDVRWYEVHCSCGKSMINVDSEGLKTYEGVLR